MTSAASPSHAGLTTAAFLFGRRDAAVAGLARAFGDGGVITRFGALGRLSSAAISIVSHRLADVAADLADIDMDTVLAAGWQKYATLANAARRTLDRPGSEELVDLASHRITSVHRPQIDILVDDVTVGSVPLELHIGVEVRGLVGTVRAGRLTAVEAARGKLNARLSCFDLTIAAREAELELNAVVDLRAGVPLVPVTGHTGDAVRTAPP